VSDSTCLCGAGTSIQTCHHVQAEIKEADPKVIILSGGPESVHVEGAPRLPAGLLEYVTEKQIPLLGICYGMQLLVHSLEGGRVESGDGEYGPMPIQ